MSGSTRVRTPRKIRPGTRPALEPGRRLTCAVLAPGPEEWVAVDLATGAFVRVRPDDTVALAGGHQALDVVTLVLGEDADPLDPSRPEAVVPAGPPEQVGRLGRRKGRRLLKRLAAPERRGLPVLGTRGPSIAFADLDGMAPSVMVVGVTARTIELRSRADGEAVFAISWAGVDWTIPVADPGARAAALGAPGPLRGAALSAALGFKPGFLLAGLGRVRDGHAPKLVLAVLPK